MITKPRQVSSEDIRKLGCEVTDMESDILGAVVEMQHPMVRDPVEKRRLMRKLKPLLESKFQYFYYAWLNRAVRVPDKILYRKIRSFRNRELITANEQSKLEHFTLGIAGMSVGSNVALASVIEGISLDEIRIADADTLSLHNLNRIRTSLLQVGRKKSHIIAEQLYELDPYIMIKVYDKGLTRKNITGFIKGVNVIVDEVDDLEIKIRLRLIAKDLRIPVVMVTDIEDRALLDIERYDLDPAYPLFHGRAGELTLDTIKNGVTNEMRVKLSTSIVGEENLTSRMKQSVAAIGKTLPTWPQMGPAAFMAGSVAAYAVKKICLDDIPSGRWLVALDKLVGVKI